MLRVAIVDDEDLARAVLREFLESDPELEIVGEAANGFEAVKLVQESKPDLLLLDIQMPKLSGFEVLELLEDTEVAVIFVTAHDEHALRAFDVAAIDYVLKPVVPERLALAVGRAKRRLADGEKSPASAALLAAARPGRLPLARVLIREEGRVHVLPVAKIDYVEAQDDYLCFRVESKKFRKQQTLADLEAQLDPRRFVRIHRSYLLNVDRLAGLEAYGKDSWVALLSGGAKLPVSRAGHARLKELLG